MLIYQLHVHLYFQLKSFAALILIQGELICSCDSETFENALVALSLGHHVSPQTLPDAKCLHKSVLSRFKDFSLDMIGKSYKGPSVFW